MEGDDILSPSRGCRLTRTGSKVPKSGTVSSKKSKARLRRLWRKGGGRAIWLWQAQSRVVTGKYLNARAWWGCHPYRDPLWHLWSCKNLLRSQSPVNRSLHEKFRLILYCQFISANILYWRNKSSHERVVGFQLICNTNETYKRKFDPMYMLYILAPRLLSTNYLLL